MRSWLPSLFCFAFLAGACCLASFAQSQTEGELHAESKWVEETGPFGLSQYLIRGEIHNRGEQAYENLQITATITDETGQLLEESAGYLIRSCGTALVDFTLRPGAAVRFVVPLEYRPPHPIDHHEITIQGETAPQGEGELATAFRRVARGEVVVLEWLSKNVLQYATGCATDPFTALRWQQYHVSSDNHFAMEHPLSVLIDEDFRRHSTIDRLSQSGERDARLYEQSFLRSHHRANRFVFQNDLGHVMSAEKSGQYPRLIDESGFRNSLQGIDWLGPGRFLAHFYGSFGDDVRYLTAQVDGRRLSRPVSESLPSQTRPGASQDGLLLVLGLAEEAPPGYYLKPAAGSALDLMYATALPGNNVPAPILYRDDEQRLAFFITPAAGEAPWQLVCLNRYSDTARVLSPLPILLPREQRAWLALSPDASLLALAADDAQGGLWLLDLPQRPCD
ncbi:MAG: hypothetical protein OXG02_08305 [Chloroflexi bacterium]|nr:hypothetical protein [Chloroflexota bacterium]